jgi:hypothetical protein
MVCKGIPIMNLNLGSCTYYIGSMIVKNIYSHARKRNEYHPRNTNTKAEQKKSARRNPNQFIQSKKSEKIETILFS